MYRNKLALHHYQGQDKGKLWAVMGGSPQPLETQALMPAGTVLAGYTACDLNLLWQWLNAIAAASEIPEFQQGLQQFRRQITSAQLDADQLFGSLGQGMGLAVVLDEQSNVTLPLGPNQQVEIASPGAFVFLQTRNDYLFKELDRLLTQQGAPVTKEDTPKYRLRAMQIPVPSPVPVMPTLVQAGDYLILGLNPQIVKAALAAKDGEAPGMTASPEFKQVAAGVPTTGNQWHYLSPRLGREVQKVQAAAMAKQPGGAPRMLAMQQLLGSLGEPGHSYGVVQVTPEGLIGVGNGNISAGKVVMLQTAVVPVAIMAGVLLRFQRKPPANALAVNSAGNMKQIGLGLLMYSGDHNGKFPDGDGLDGFNELIAQSFIQAGKVWVHPASNRHTASNQGPLTPANCSYLYVGAGVKDDSPMATIMPLTMEQPGITPNGVCIGYVDGHVELLSGRFTSVAAAMESLLGRHAYPADVAAKLREKATALDAKRAEYGY